MFFLDIIITIKKDYKFKLADSNYKSLSDLEAISYLSPDSIDLHL